MARFAVAAAFAVVLAGCGGDEKQTTTPTQRAPLRIYYLRDGRVQPVLRGAGSGGFPMTALAELSKGPTAVEKEALGLTNAAAGPYHYDGSSGVVKDQGSFTRPEIAQIVYTITQYSVKTAVVDGRTYTRADFEDETPSILVESPLPFATVKSPLRATGTANTFEATFQYDLVAPGGKVVKTHFVTATSGTGTRGTFVVSAPFKLDRAGQGKLVVYELSAKDGSRIHVVPIPINLTP